MRRKGEFPVSLNNLNLMDLDIDMMTTLHENMINNPQKEINDERAAFINQSSLN